MFLRKNKFVSNKDICYSKINFGENAFTLIELLAIIVILAIIAVITVPIILNIIENSKKGAATDSAYGYKDSVNKFYVLELSKDSEYNIPSNTYTTAQLKTLGVAIDGKEPKENSWVTIERNAITVGCLQYDDYAVTFKDGSIEKTEKSECENPSETTQYLYINENIRISPDLYILEWDQNENDYIKIKKIQLSDGFTTRPADADVYLKYALTNGIVADGTVPETCMYSTTIGDELCANSDDFEITSQKIKTFFKWDDEKNSSKYENVNCTFNNTYSDCSDSNVLVYFSSYDHNQVGMSNSLNFNCYIDYDHTADCYWD